VPPSDDQPAFVPPPGRDYRVLRRSVVSMNQPQQRKEEPKRQVLHPSCLWYIPPVLPHHSLTVVAD
jgi:hypothetical protein